MFCFLSKIGILFSCLLVACWFLVLRATRNPPLAPSRRGIVVIARTPVFEAISIDSHSRTDFAMTKNKPLNREEKCPKDREGDVLEEVFISISRKMPYAKWEKTPTSWEKTCASWEKSCASWEKSCASCMPFAESVVCIGVNGYLIICWRLLHFIRNDIDYSLKGG